MTFHAEIAPQIKGNTKSPQVTVPSVPADWQPRPPIPDEELIAIIQDETTLPSVKKSFAALLVDRFASHPGASRDGAQARVHDLLRDARHK